MGGGAMGGFSAPAFAAAPAFTDAFAAPAITMGGGMGGAMGGFSAPVFTEAFAAPAITTVAAPAVTMPTATLAAAPVFAAPAIMTTAAPAVTMPTTTLTAPMTMSAPAMTEVFAAPLATTYGALPMTAASPSTCPNCGNLYMDDSR